jgi:hypothetical protein
MVRPSGDAEQLGPVMGRRRGQRNRQERGLAVDGNHCAVGRLGGWYDSAPPPQLDYVGLGLRVPCIIISPYVKKGHVAHTRYEFGSILKFMEQTFKLQSLGSTDVRANSLLDVFDFTQKPRPFVQFATQLRRGSFENSTPRTNRPTTISHRDRTALGSRRAAALASTLANPGSANNLLTA